MGFFGAMDILASGLRAQRVRMDIGSSNLANADVTRTDEGGPYRRLDPVLSAEPTTDFGSALSGALHRVEVAEIVVDPKPPRVEYDPSHPDARPDGTVELPNVNALSEMVGIMSAARAYETDTTALKTLVEMAQKALTIGK